MSNLFSKENLSVGNNVEKSEQLRKTLFTTKNAFCTSLIPVKNDFIEKEVSEKASVPSAQGFRE